MHLPISHPPQNTTPIKQVPSIPTIQPSLIRERFSRWLEMQMTIGLFYTHTHTHATPNSPLCGQPRPTAKHPGLFLYTCTRIWRALSLEISPPPLQLHQRCSPSYIRVTYADHQVLQHFHCTTYHVQHSRATSWAAWRWQNLLAKTTCTLMGKMNSTRLQEGCQSGWQQWQDQAPQVQTQRGGTTHWSITWDAISFKTRMVLLHLVQSNTSKQYIKKLLGNYKVMFRHQPKEFSAPLEKNDHQSWAQWISVTSWISQPKNSSCWLVKLYSTVGNFALGCFDIGTATMTMSQFRWHQGRNTWVNYKGSLATSSNSNMQPFKFILVYPITLDFQRWHMTGHTWPMATSLITRRHKPCRLTQARYCWITCSHRS